MILGTKDVTEMLKNASELEISKAISKGIKLVQSAARAECPGGSRRTAGKYFHRGRDRRPECNRHLLYR